MSSDPKKPPFDAPPPGTPDLLQKDLGLDRRRRVPSFEELQHGAEATTEPMRPAAQRPTAIPAGTVPARPGNREEPSQAAPRPQVPPGMQPRQAPPAPARPPAAAAPTQPARAPAAQPARPPGAPRTAPPSASELWAAQQQQRPPAAPPQRVAPPSPVEYAQARPSASGLPQVTPSVPSLGAVVPEGQSTPARAQAAHQPAPVARAPLGDDDEPEPRTLQAPNPVRTFTPSPPPAPPRRASLPPEMLVTQPGLPGPFAQARAMPQPQAVPQRPPSLPELAALNAPTTAGPAFEAPKFDAPLLPEQEPGTVMAEPAALWRRGGAWLTDLLFISVLVLGFLTVASALIAPQDVSPLQQLLAVAVPGAALGAVLAFVYTALFAFLWSGRTPGRRLMGIHLVDTTGHAPGPLKALVRAGLSLVSFALFLSGFWLALFDRHGQTLHDKLTRTFVVKLQDA